MDNWRESLVADLLEAASSETALFQQVKIISERFGFEYYAYGYRVPSSLDHPTTVLLNNYPETWQTEYRERRYVDIDPSVRHALKSNLPYAWPGNALQDELRFWEEARSHGLRFGWAMASRGKHGTIGMLTLSRSAEPLTAAEREAGEVRWSWLSLAVHEIMNGVLAQRYIPELAGKITARERDVLSWSATGKTAFEIAIILNISAATVNFHVSNLLIKLNATNKVQAVLKAAMLGLL
jgi:DNA-binding CsgD family transcriptional regulator